MRPFALIQGGGFVLLAALRAGVAQHQRRSRPVGVGPSQARHRLQPGRSPMQALSVRPPGSRGSRRLVAVGVADLAAASGLAAVRALLSLLKPTTGSRSCQGEGRWRERVRRTPTRLHWLQGMSLQLARQHAGVPAAASSINRLQPDKFRQRTSGARSGLLMPDTAGIFGWRRFSGGDGFGNQVVGW